MGADDDLNCLEHDWGLEEIHLTLKGAQMASTCNRCGAVLYEPSASDDPLRRPL